MKTKKNDIYLVFFRYIFLVVVFGCNITFAGNQGEIISSPNNQNKIYFSEKVGGERGAYIIQPRVLDSTEGSSSNSYTMFGSILDYYWNEKSSYIAINNRLGSQGSVIWIFTFPQCLAITKDLIVKNSSFHISDEIDKISPKSAQKYLDPQTRSFAYGWEANDILLVITLVISRNDEDGIFVAYQEFKVNKNQTVTFLKSKVERLLSQDFHTLPSIVVKYWGGWNSSCWKNPGTKPSK